MKKIFSNKYFYIILILIVLNVLVCIINEKSYNEYNIYDLGNDIRTVLNKPF